MLDNVAIDITPTTVPAFVRQVRDHDSSGARSPTGMQSAMTTHMGNVYVFSKSDDPPSGRDNWAIHKSGYSAFPATEANADLQRAAADRVRLLATKYEDQASVQDVARLEILTARLNRLAPRTTAADIVKVEETVDLIERIDTTLDGLAMEYDV